MPKSIEVPAEKTIAFKSLGCKLNQYEIQAMREGFLKQGFVEVPFSSRAGTYILNTCTVTHAADCEARSLIRFCGRLNPGARVIVTGCYATASREEVGGMPEVDVVVDNRSKSRIVAAVAGVPETAKEEDRFFKEGISYFENRSRAFVKVQDGCDYFCTYCKVPFVRGRVVSKDEANILEEVRRLVAAGYGEIVLSGVCLGSYGKDLKSRIGLVELLESVLSEPGCFRVRLSSIDPRDAPLELARLMGRSTKLCPHLHLSLQSGDDRVLQRMKRGYSTREFADLVHAIRKEVPGIGLSTDVMVGFPGEDERAFENTCRLVETVLFHRVHVFGYSQRQGTKAVRLDEKVPAKVIRQRIGRLKEILPAVTDKYLRHFVGRTLEVLVESKQTGGSLLQGFSQNYARCVFPGDDCLKGTLQMVRVLEADNGILRCELCCSGSSPLR